MKTNTLSGRGPAQTWVMVSLGVVCLGLVLGLGLSSPQAAQAGAIEGVSVEELQVVGLADRAGTTTGTGSSLALANFSGSAYFGGPATAGYVNVSGTARVTTTIHLSTDSTVPISVTVTGTIPITVTEPLYTMNVGGGVYTDYSSEVYGTTAITVVTTANPGGNNVVVVRDVSVSGRVHVNTVSPPTTVTVSGSGPASGSNTLTVTEQGSTRYDYLPAVSRTFVPEGCFDDFSSYETGIWPKGTSGNCTVGYTSGYYQIRVNDGWTGSAYKCVVITRNGCGQVPGTVHVEARRTSSKSYHLYYGFYFSAGSNYTKDRWAVEVRPDEVCEDDDDEIPYVWLNCLDGGKECFSNKSKCDDDINVSGWNDIKVTRDGSDVKLYINDEMLISKSNAEGATDPYFNLFAYSLNNKNDVVVQFDDFYVIPSIE